MKKLLLLLVVCMLSLTTYASEDDHPITKIIGDNIDLSSKGHTISGRIKDKLVFGDVSTVDGHKSSSIIIKAGEELIQTDFSQENGKWGGEISNSKKAAKIEFVRLMKDIPAYVIAVNGVEHTVRVEADDFKNNHFINPKYILNLNGKEISAKMIKGQACYMYSLHLIFMIFGTYLF